MCSTAKPNRSNLGRTLASSTSILAALNSTQRQAFAERANKASKRRVSSRRAIKQKYQEAHSSARQPHSNSRQAELKKSWDYWLLSASLAEVIQKLTSP